MTQHLQIIINPAAGQNQPILNTFNDVFQPLELVWDVSITRGPGDAHRLAEQAVRAGVDIVGAYGGDGTVAEVSTALAGTDVPLAIFPGGTGNVLAHELGLPQALEQSAGLLATDYAVRRVDLGQVDDKAFLVTVTSGIFAEMIRHADRDMKDRFGMMAYALSGVQALTTTPQVRYRLTIDGQQVESEGVACLVANCVNFRVGGISMSPTIDLQDGKLDVVVIRGTDLQSLLAVVAGAVTPDRQILDPIQHWQGKEITLKVDPPQAISYDGELLDPGPLHISVLPEAMRVIVPA
jgi:diacylglycerol kinase (ATP)